MPLQRCIPPQSCLYEVYAFFIANIYLFLGRTSDASNNIATELKTVQLPVLTNAVCGNTYGSMITNQIICTSGAGNRGACNGDSGGPLVVSGVEVGVVSFGSRLCEAGNPTAYARVSFFRNWISTNSGV